MTRSKGVTLKGPMAGAFVEAMAGKKPTLESDKQLRIATFIYMAMTTGDHDHAKRILQSVADRGIDETANDLTK